MEESFLIFLEKIHFLLDFFWKVYYNEFVIWGNDIGDNLKKGDKNGWPIKETNVRYASW